VLSYMQDTMRTHILRLLVTPLATLTMLACGGEDLVLPPDGAPSSSAHLVVAGGNAQVGQPGLPLSERVRVQLLDESGNGISDQPITWAIASGGGSVVPEISTTDSAGFASTTWTLGAPGPNSLTAVVPGVASVTFTAMATEGDGGGGSGSDGLPSATTSTVSADPASIPVATGISTIRVTVRDASGAPVSGAIVTLTVSGSGNILTQPDGPTGSDGVATGTLSSTVAGTKDVVATVDGSVQINQTAQVTVTISPATRVELVEGNDQRADVGTDVPVRPAVRVVDAQGNPVVGYGVTFVVTRGNGSVAGAIQTTNAQGIARVDSWTLGEAGRNTLEARAGSLQGSPVIFEATAVAPPPPPPPPAAQPDHFVFQVPPRDVEKDEQFRVEVAIVDVSGNVVPLDGIEIYIGLFREGSDVASNGLLEGDRFKETENGVAVFNLSIRDRGRYRMRALSDELPQLGPYGPEPWLYSGLFTVF
jgi:hypothetical protein